MRDDDSQSSGLSNEGGGTISGGGAWFDASNRVSGAASDHLMSALPVYEPIDMARATAHSSSSSSSPPSSALGGAQTSSSSSGGGGLGRATQPTLPDARLLAPMASLTDVFPPGIGDYNALSNRELRFAVENHMLVEQHRYLIRDLGHARSAIAALKQVVQAKEERFESYELANVELQQRVALLESLLTPEQRQQLACMPYAFNMCSVSSSSSHQSLHSQSAAHDVPGDEGAEAPLQPPDLDEPCGSGSGGGAGFALVTSAAAAAAAEARRNNGRPLSGYVTGYSFNDKPVGHLPRVFSGDYSAANVQAMETSVEALANAIAAMPRDEATVEDIIASKMPEKQSGANSSDSAADDDDASPHHSQPQQPGAAGVKAKQHSAAEHPRQPKRRSRFFSALRLSSFNGAAASAAPVVGEGANRSRRSVSLGSTQRPAAAGVAEQQLATMTMTPGGYSEAEAETAASCPTLLIPGITGGQPRSATTTTTQRTARRQASADSFGSAAGGGRYPASLGLASGGSDKASSRRVPSGVSSCEDDEPHARQPQRLSFTPQPRRSTSAPSSRPQSMRVASRRSWLLQLFGSSSSSSTGGGEPPVTEAVEEAAAGGGGGLWQRRRVMTQSSTEVAQLLGALQLSGEPAAGAGAAHGGGPLEDVADVSGEDEERAARPSLSVAEIRQQTLDALNGTLPRVAQPVQPAMRILSLPHASAAAAAALGADNDEPPEPPAVGSRWRQRESSVPTIMRLNPPPPPALLPAASLGLGVSVARRGSLPTTALTPLAGLIAGAGAGGDSAGASSPPSDRRSQAQSPPGGGGGGGAPDDAANGKRWAPAFWAPPPPVLSPAAAANHQATWASPRDSADSFESASMASRLSDDARQQPMAARGSLSLRHRHGGGSSSPWEMVRAGESRTTFSPTHSRPGTPPPPQSSARSLGFFEDSTVVPDSDELATAARRSLSLRMSRNAFKQAEPLPEADDALDAPSSSSSSSSSSFSSPALSMAVESSAILAPPGTSSSPAPPRNNALARVAADAAAQPKRRSLLWQFNSKHSHPPHPPPPRSDCASVASSDDKTAPPSAAAGDDDLLLLKDTCVMTSVVTAAAAAPPKRPKKWWSAVLG
ncbi:hypothetical protein GGF42_003758 [Coemansia sp. RSA 2424]|nr:hypothetical protein GGF42_003758 [Coemansia sp. RSA 2424]